VELWLVRQQGRELRTVAVYLPTCIDLHSMEGHDVRRTEPLRDAPARHPGAAERKVRLLELGGGDDRI
jgi:hypothetical protein